MPSTLEQLKTALREKAEDVITDEITRLECLADIDAWYGCRVAVDALSGEKIASYTHQGRTVTRRNLPDMQLQAAALYDRIKAALYATGSVLVDNRTGDGV